MHVLVVEPVLEDRRVFGAVALDICDAGRTEVNISGTNDAYSQRIDAWKGHSPFTLPVHLMLGERDIFVINVDTQVEGDLPEILISRPL